MANTLGTYDEVFYAQEGLIQLQKVLGMANRVHRGYDEERRSFGKGQTMEINRPATFTVQDAPSSAQDVNPGTTTLSLDYWKEVKFGLTDRELAFTGDKIIADHIVPAAYALAEDIDSKLAALALGVGNTYDWTGTVATPATSDITGPKRILFDAKVPQGNPAMNHYMVDGYGQETFENNAAFTQSQGAGDQGIASQMSGQIGMKYSYNIFANQNVQSTVGNTITDGAGAAVGAVAMDAVSVPVDAMGSTEAFKAGNMVTFAGHSVIYALAADVTMSGGAGTLTLASPLQAAVADNEVVTVTSPVNAGSTVSENLMFHRNFAAFASAPLSEAGNQLGAKIATAFDPVTGLALRSRMFYEGNSSKVFVALDVLYGFRVLDPSLACRVLRTQ